MSDTPIKSKTDTKLKIEPKLNVQEPRLFRVIFVNDEITTMEFIIETLKVIFGYEEDEANDKTMQIHEQGSGVIAVYPFEIAEQKGIEVTLLARNNGFPLQVKLEVEN